MLGVRGTGEAHCLARHRVKFAEAAEVISCSGTAVPTKLVPGAAHPGAGVIHFWGKQH